MRETRISDKRLTWLLADCEYVCGNSDTCKALRELQSQRQILRRMAEALEAMLTIPAAFQPASGYENHVRSKSYYARAVLAEYREAVK